MINLPVTLTGYIVHGKHLGTHFGMPTANIDPAEDVSDLAHGVYFSVITVDQKQYAAITNLGTRPTVSNDGRVNAETFICGYDGDLYGKEAKITLLLFHRPEKRFSSADELFRTISEDIIAGAKYHHFPEDELPEALTSSSIASV